MFSETNYVASKRHLLARYCCFWWQESGIDGGAFTQTSVFFVRIILVIFVLHFPCHLCLFYAGHLSLYNSGHLCLYHPCHPIESSGERSVCVEQQIDDKTKKVEVILSSYHSAIDFRYVDRQLTHQYPLPD